MGYLELKSEEKKKDGLGVKHIELFNLTLLSKWKWHVLNEQGKIWSGYLSYIDWDIKAKTFYGDNSMIGK